jgi:hypothetical protein
MNVKVLLFGMNVKVLLCSVTEIKKLGIHGETWHKLLDDGLLQSVMCSWRELNEFAIGEPDRDQPFRLVEAPWQREDMAHAFDCAVSGAKGKTWVKRKALLTIEALCAASSMKPSR